MQAWQATNRQRRVGTIGAVILAHTLCFAAPAAASSNSLTICDDGEKDALEFSTTVLQLVARNDADESELVAPELVDDTGMTHARPSPAIDAKVRKRADNTPAPDSDAVNPPIMNARVPGISDEALARYKEQMYRKDI